MTQSLKDLSIVRLEFHNLGVHSPWVVFWRGISWLLARNLDKRSLNHSLRCFLLCLIRCRSTGRREEEEEGPVEQGPVGHARSCEKDAGGRRGHAAGGRRADTEGGGSRECAVGEGLYQYHTVWGLHLRQYI